MNSLARSRHCNAVQGVDKKLERTAGRMVLKLGFSRILRVFRAASAFLQRLLDSRSLTTYEFMAIAACEGREKREAVDLFQYVLQYRTMLTVHTERMENRPIVVNNRTAPLGGTKMESHHKLTV